MTKRVYISGPMTGYVDFNKPRFNQEADRLRSLGYDVVNPAELNPDPTTPWQQCLRKDIAELVTCDALVMIEGWERSNGAHLEIHIAHRVGMEIVLARDLQA
jgi:hypothetical protein